MMQYSVKSFVGEVKIFQYRSYSDTLFIVLKAFRHNIIQNSFPAMTKRSMSQIMPESNCLC